MYKINVVFSKKEEARFIGHLDILRTFVRTVRRAGLPLKYSDGFNPHAVVSFALPIGVGITSECEVVYVTLTEKVGENEFVERFNKHATAGIKVISAKYDQPPIKISRARYEIFIYGNNLDELSKVSQLPNIIVDKKSKKKTKEVDLKEHIFEFSYDIINDTTAKINMVISAGPDFNVKPNLVLDGIKKYTNLEIFEAYPHRKEFME